MLFEVFLISECDQTLLVQKRFKIEAVPSEL